MEVGFRSRSAAPGSCRISFCVFFLRMRVLLVSYGHDLHRLDGEKRLDPERRVSYYVFPDNKVGNLVRVAG